MKISINPAYEIDNKLLLAKNLNYTQIFYFAMCFLYIYNMELRRSLVAQVSATVKPWDMDATDYSADGTITEDNE